MVYDPDPPGPYRAASGSPLHPPTTVVYSLSGLVETPPPAAVLGSLLAAPRPRASGPSTGSLPQLALPSSSASPQPLPLHVGAHRVPTSGATSVGGPLAPVGLVHAGSIGGIGGIGGMGRRFASGAAPAPAPAAPPTSPLAVAVGCALASHTLPSPISPSRPHGAAWANRSVDRTAGGVDDRNTSQSQTDGSRPTRAGWRNRAVPSAVVSTGTARSAAAPHPHLLSASPHDSTPAPASGTDRSSLRAPAPQAMGVSPPRSHTAPPAQSPRAPAASVGVLRLRLPRGDDDADAHGSHPYTTGPDGATLFASREYPHPSPADAAGAARGDRPASAAPHIGAALTLFDAPGSSYFAAAATPDHSTLAAAPGPANFPDSARPPPSHTPASGGGSTRRHRTASQPSLSYLQTPTSHAQQSTQPAGAPRQRSAGAARRGDALTDAASSAATEKGEGGPDRVTSRRRVVRRPVVRASTARPHANGTAAVRLARSAGDRMGARTPSPIQSAAHPPPPAASGARPASPAGLRVPSPPSVADGRVPRRTVSNSIALPPVTLPRAASLGPDGADPTRGSGARRVLLARLRASRTASWNGAAGALGGPLGSSLNARHSSVGVPAASHRGAGLATPRRSASSGRATVTPMGASRGGAVYVPPGVESRLMRWAARDAAGGSDADLARGVDPMSSSDGFAGGPLPTTPSADDIVTPVVVASTYTPQTAGGPIAAPPRGAAAAAGRYRHRPSPSHPRPYLGSERALPPPVVSDRVSGGDLPLDGGALAPFVAALHTGNEGAATVTYSTASSACDGWSPVELLPPDDAWPHGPMVSVAGASVHPSAAASGTTSAMGVPSATASAYDIGARTATMEVTIPVSPHAPAPLAQTFPSPPMGEGWLASVDPPSPTTAKAVVQPPPPSAALLPPPPLPPGAVPLPSYAHAVNGAKAFLGDASLHTRAPATQPCVDTLSPSLSPTTTPRASGADDVHSAASHAELMRAAGAHVRAPRARPVGAAPSRCVAVDPSVVVDDDAPLPTILEPSPPRAREGRVGLGGSGDLAPGGGGDDAYPPSPPTAARHDVSVATTAGVAVGDMRAAEVWPQEREAAWDDDADDDGYTTAPQASSLRKHTALGGVVVGVRFDPRAPDDGPGNPPQMIDNAANPTGRDTSLPRPLPAPVTAVDALTALLAAERDARSFDIWLQPPTLPRPQIPPSLTTVSATSPALGPTPATGASVSAPADATTSERPTPPHVDGMCHASPWSLTSPLAPPGTAAAAHAAVAAAVGAALHIDESTRASSAMAATVTTAGAHNDDRPPTDPSATAAGSAATAGGASAAGCAAVTGTAIATPSVATAPREDAPAAHLASSHPPADTPDLSHTAGYCQHGGQSHLPASPTFHRNSGGSDLFDTAGASALATAPAGRRARESVLLGPASPSPALPPFALTGGCSHPALAVHAYQGFGASSLAPFDATATAAFGGVPAATIEPTDDISVTPSSAVRPHLSHVASIPHEECGGQYGGTATAAGAPLSFATQYTDVSTPVGAARTDVTARYATVAHAPSSPAIAFARGDHFPISPTPRGPRGDSPLSPPARPSGSHARTASSHSSYGYPTPHIVVRRTDRGATSWPGGGAAGTDGGGTDPFTLSSSQTPPDSGHRQRPVPPAPGGALHPHPPPRLGQLDGAGDAAPGTPPTAASVAAASVIVSGSPRHAGIAAEPAATTTYVHLRASAPITPHSPDSAPSPRSPYHMGAQHDHGSASESLAHTPPAWFVAGQRAVQMMAAASPSIPPSASSTPPSSASRPSLRPTLPPAARPATPPGADSPATIPLAHASASIPYPDDSHPASASAPAVPSPQGPAPPPTHPAPSLPPTATAAAGGATEAVVPSTTPHPPAGASPPSRSAHHRASAAASSASPFMASPATASSVDQYPWHAPHRGDPFPYSASYHAISVSPSPSPPSAGPVDAAWHPYPSSLSHSPGPSSAPSRRHPTLPPDPPTPPPSALSECAMRSLTRAALRAAAPRTPAHGALAANALAASPRVGTLGLAAAVALAAHITRPAAGSAPPPPHPPTAGSAVGAAPLRAASPPRDTVVHPSSELLLPATASYSESPNPQPAVLAPSSPPTTGPCSSATGTAACAVVMSDLVNLSTSALCSTACPAGPYTAPPSCPACRVDGCADCCTRPRSCPPQPPPLPPTLSRTLSGRPIAPCAAAAPFLLGPAGVPPRVLTPIPVALETLGHSSGSLGAEAVLHDAPAASVVVMPSDEVCADGPAGACEGPLDVTTQGVCGSTSDMTVGSSGSVLSCRHPPVIPPPPVVALHAALGADAVGFAPHGAFAFPEPPPMQVFTFLDPAIMCEFDGE